MLTYHFKELVTIFIPTNTPSSKNGRVWTGSHFIASKATYKWRKETKKFWIEGKELFLKAVVDNNLQLPLDIEFTFIRKSKHKFDYVNPLQTILDEMTAYKWIEDDNTDVIKPFFGSYKYDKNNPGVYITLLKQIEQKDD